MMKGGWVISMEVLGSGKSLLAFEPIFFFQKSMLLRCVYMQCADRWMEERGCCHYFMEWWYEENLSANPLNMR